MKTTTNLTCKLTTPELQERKRTVIAELKNLVLETKETSNGIRFKFNGSDSTIDLLTASSKPNASAATFSRSP